MYDVALAGGCLKEFRMLESMEIPEKVRGRIWYLYEVMAAETPWCNNQTYVDTLNEEAVKDFITKTHEKYAAVLQEEFGKSIPAIFTDEPHISGMSLSEQAIGKETLLNALEPWREVEVKGEDGSRKEFYLHQFRQEGKTRWFFLAQAYRDYQLF